MRPIHILMMVGVMMMTVLVGCTEELLDLTPTTAPTTEDTTTDTTTTDDTATTDTTTTDTTTTEDTAVTTVDRPLYQTLPLVDARTGATFTLADFAGKTVFVEPMATWCSNCRSQLRNVRTALEQLAGEDVIFVALSVEVGLGNDSLASYTENNGFDWYFAVVDTAMLTELVNVFGRTVTNPPSTPHFVIRPDGTATSLSTGSKSVDQIVNELRSEGGF